MTANERFRAKFEELQTLRAEYARVTNPETGMAAELDRELAPLFTGRKAKWDRAKRWGSPEAGEIVEKYRQQAATFGARHKERTTELELSLKELAPACDLALERAETWATMGSRSITTYMSTGDGEKYARASAQGYLDQAALYGVEARLREEKDDKGRTWSYIAEVRLTPVGVAILDGKPGITLREWVRLCWKRGCQPRVFNPWLPHDYEAKNGLDYFGNEIPKSGNCAAG